MLYATTYLPVHDFCYLCACLPTSTMHFYPSLYPCCMPLIPASPALTLLPCRRVPGCVYHFTMAIFSAMPVPFYPIPCLAHLPVPACPSSGVKAESAGCPAPSATCTRYLPTPCADMGSLLSSAHRELWPACGSALPCGLEEPGSVQVYCTCRWWWHHLQASISVRPTSPQWPLHSTRQLQHCTMPQLPAFPWFCTACVSSFSCATTFRVHAHTTYSLYLPMCPYLAFPFSSSNDSGVWHYLPVHTVGIIQFGPTAVSPSHMHYHATATIHLAALPATCLYLLLPHPVPKSGQAGVISIL